MPNPELANSEVPDPDDSPVFAGIRVLEVATWAMVPSAGVVLAEFGADVVKVEHPVGGDPQRALVSGGYAPSVGGVSLTMEQCNRGKRSIGLDIATVEGQAVLYALAAKSDVFLTNVLPTNRAKLGIDVGHIRAANGRIIYVRGSALGPHGAEADRAGFDTSVYWARSGLGHALTEGQARPVRQRGALGDKTGAMNIAFAVAAALFKRERTGKGSVIDVSLLSTALWVNSSDVVYSAALGEDFSRREVPATNPLSHGYRTRDNRWIWLQMMQPDRWWAELCELLGRLDLADDPRYANAGVRRQHAAECAAELAATFASASMAEWRARLATFSGPWEPFQDPYEIGLDGQVRGNDYVTEVEHPNGHRLTVVRAPVEFDESHPSLGTAPQAFEHTEEVLLELGYDWDAIGGLKTRNVIP